MDNSNKYAKNAIMLAAIPVISAIPTAMWLYWTGSEVPSVVEYLGKIGSALILMGGLPLSAIAFVFMGLAKKWNEERSLIIFGYIIVIVAVAISTIALTPIILPLLGLETPTWLLLKP